MPRPLVAAVLAALFLAVAATAHALGGYVDQYPDDVSAFACAVPPVDITQDGATPIECSLMLTACIDAATGQCVAVDPKGCKAAHEACIAWIDDTCWPQVGD
jgi:hypothetical protein